MTSVSSEFPGPDDRESRAALAILRKSGLDGMTTAQLGAAANITDERVQRLLAGFVADGRAIVVVKPAVYLAGDVACAVLAQVTQRLAARQQERPWLMGVTSLALAQSVNVPEATLVRVLAAHVDAGELAYRGGYYATSDFTPRLTAEQQTFFDAAFATQENETSPGPIAFEHLRSEIRASKVPELSAAFETLVTGGVLSKVGDFVYRGAQMAELRTKLETALRAGGHITVAEFRDITGTSRKYAVPLLEFFDATGVTVRNGDVRVLRHCALPKRK